MSKYWIRSTIAVLCFFVTAVITPAIETADDTDFRAARWGMTGKEVNDLETLSMNSNGYDFITYDHIVFDEAVVVTYEFENEVLTEAAYEFMPWPSSYTGLFRSCREALIEQHGEPADQMFVYHGATFPSLTEQEMESAMTDGRLEQIVEWVTERSQIRLYAGQSSDWFPPLVNIRYSVREER